MSSTSTSTRRLPTLRAVDVLGVLAVTLSLLLGLVPGIGVPTADADASCDPVTITNGSGKVLREFDRVRFDLVNDTESRTIDTDDADVSCGLDGNALEIYVGGVQVRVLGDWADAPDFHTSCSVDYDGSGVQVAIGDSVYTIEAEYWNWTIAPGSSSGGCDPFPGSFFPQVTLVKTAVLGTADADSDLLDDTADDPYLVFSPGDDEGPKTALYSYLITNTGDEALDLQSLSDNRLGSIDLSGCADPLPVDGTCTVTAREDFGIGDAPAADVTNIATVIASGDQSGTQVQDVDDAVIDLEVSYDPAITLVKTAVVGAGSDLVDGGDGNDYLVFSPGDDEGPKTALYSYLITNTGDEALTSIGLTDDLVDSGDLDLSDCAGTLAMGDSCTATGTDQFSIGDAPGEVTNTATATGVGEQSQQEVADHDDETIDLRVDYDPAITLVKTAVVGAGSDLVDGGDGNDYLVFSPGDDEGPKTALYSYLITNSGDEALDLQSLSDNRLGAVDLSGCEDPLPVDGTCTVTAGEDFDLGDAPAADVTNTATVTAVGTQSQEQVQDVDDAVIDLVVSYDPAITLVKTSVVGAGSDLVDGGDGNDYLVFSPGDDEGPKTALYSYLITNSGDEALDLQSLSDNRLGSIDLSGCADPLPVDGTCTVTAGEDFDLGDAPAADVTNTATVTAVGTQSQEQVQDVDDAVIDLVVSYDPAITLVKTAVLGTADADSDLLDDIFDDPYLVFSPGDDEGPKTAVFSYRITNTGDESLVLTGMSDNRLGTVDLGGCDSPLAVGASCTVTAGEDFDLGDAPAADVTNTATVTAVGTQSQEQVQDVDDAVIDLEVTYDRGISLTKVSVVGEGSDLVDGDEDNDFLFWAEDATGSQTARYSYTITNTGDEPLVDLELVDDRAAIGTVDLGGCPEVLEVGADCTVFADESFARPENADRVTNTGTVTGTGQESGGGVSAQDPATIDLLGVLPRVIDAIEIDLVKSVVLGAGDVDDEGVVTWAQDDYEAGDARTVVYRFTVTNVGEATIVDVELTDPMVSDEPIIAVADGVTLEPGESRVVDVKYSLTVGQAFPDGQATASRIVNVATVTGANVTRDAFSEASDDASVTTQVVFAEVQELPETGLPSGLLLPLGVLLAALGAAILWVERRRRPTA